MHTLVIVNPGHFHAALVLRESHPDLSDDVYIYSLPGADLDNFMKLAESFNRRAQSPTRWRFHIVSGNDYLARAIADRAGDIAVLAGRNDCKIDDMLALHRAGFRILGDKPLTIDGRGVGLLKDLLADGPVTMDIMTERHESTSLLQRALLRNPEIFGEPAADGDRPAIEKESVHFLCKMVNGVPLVRPQWFFDVTRQGEGIVDVTTHLVDLIQWMIGGDRTFSFERDVVLESARGWDTLVPLAKFQQATRAEAFPPELADRVADGQLAVRCNGEFRYRLDGIPVRISVVWDLEPAPGAGDTHYSVMRGTRATLEVEQGPRTGGRPELFVTPADGDTAALRRRLTAVLPSLPCAGVSIVETNGRCRLEIPQEQRSTHEMHFAAVRDEFLGMVDGGAEPANLRPNLLTKYQLLAAARDLSSR